MPGALPLAYGERGGDTVENALHIDVDHCCPVGKLNLGERRNGSDASAADEDIQTAEPVGCE